MIETSKFGGVAARSFKCGEATIVVRIVENKDWTYKVTVVAEGCEPYHTEVSSRLRRHAEDSVEAMKDAAYAGCAFCADEGGDAAMAFDWTETGLDIVPEDVDEGAA